MDSIIISHQWLGSEKRGCNRFVTGRTVVCGSSEVRVGGFWIWGQIPKQRWHFPEACCLPHSSSFSRNFFVQGFLYLAPPLLLRVAGLGLEARVAIVGLRRRAFLLRVLRSSCDARFFPRCSLGFRRSNEKAA